MSKPTSTALNVNDLFSGDSVHPRHGDGASQGPAARKSGATIASTARPSPPAAEGAADPAETAASVHGTASLYATHISVSVYSTYFDPGDQYVESGGQITLVSKCGWPVTVYLDPPSAFKSPLSSCSAATGGSTYSLDPGFAGKLTLSLSNGPSVIGTNGTINVGGGGGSNPPLPHYDR